MRETRDMRLFIRVITSATLTLALGAGVGCAQLGLGTGVRAPSLSLEDALSGATGDCRQVTQAGLDVLPTTWTSGAERRREALGNAESLLTRARALCTPAVPGVGESDADTQRLERLSLGVADGKRQLAILEVYEPIENARANDEAVPDGALDDLDAAVAAYVDWAEAPDNKRWAGLWQKRASSLRATVEARAETRAGREAQAAVDRAMLEQHAAIDGAVATFEAIDAHARAGESPIPAELYAQYEAHVAAIETFNPTARLFFEPELQIYKAYDAWRSDDAPAALAALYEAELIGSGVSRGSKQSVPINANAGWCYAVLLHFEGPDTLAELAWANPTRMRKALRFSGVDRMTKPWQRMRGVCTNEAVRLTLAGELKATGRGRPAAQRWVVVGWPRDQFPAPLALRITPRPDTCDPVQYEQSYVQPIPGALPHRQPGDIETWEPRYSEHSRGGLGRPGVCGAAPGTHTNPESERFAACRVRVRTRWAGRLNAAARARDKGRTLNARIAGRERFESLVRSRDEDIQKTCSPIYERIYEAQLEAVARVGDHMKGQAYTDHIDRAQREADEAAARSRPRNSFGRVDTITDRDRRRDRLRRFEQYFPR